MALNYSPVQNYSSESSYYKQPVARTTGGALYSPAPSVKGISTDNVKTGSTQTTSPTDLINNGVTAGNDSIERSFQDSLAQADTAEAGLRSQAAQATGEINTQAQQTRNSLAQQQATGLEGIAGQEQTAQTQAKTGLQGARDLFRQTQQNNIAQLSALGLSSSSVMEGLAEKLGVETARRIGGITGSLNEVMQNLSKERARVNDYAKAKLTEIDQGVQNQISSINNQLLQGIRQIQDSRQLAATAKANARAELMTQAQNQVYQIQSNAQQFAQQLQQWQTQKSNVLTEAEKGFTINPTDTSALQSAINRFQGISATGGLIQPYIETGSNGYLRVTPQYSPSKQTNDPYEQMVQKLGTAQ